MASEPKAPGAHAVILYREVDRNDNAFEEHDYLRIKILDQAGLDAANVAIPVISNYESVSGIVGRTIEPDGTIVAFHGKVYSKPVAQSRDVKVLDEVFALPDARVGSIIEYRYVVHLRPGYLYNSRWILSGPLYTEDAKFSLVPHRTLGVRARWPQGLPAGTLPPAKHGGVIELEAHDVPAFVREPYMPPPNALRYVVDFVYLTSPDPAKDPVKFWSAYARNVDVLVDRFVGGSRAFRRDLSQIVAPGDSPEIELEKIYARVQRIRNTSFAPRGTATRASGEDPAAIHDAQDVWTKGYGVRQQITWLCLALARAAGLDASPVVVSTRDTNFFNAALMDPGELDATLVDVKLNGKDLYLAPGVPFTPFGMLPWQETGVRALRLGRDGGQWVATPYPAADASQITRQATLRLAPDGSLEGKVVVTYTGLEALWRRLQERNDDDTGRKRFLENELKRAVPSGIKVTLTNEPDWSGSTPILTADFDLKVPGWASRAGSFELLGAELFGAQARTMFVKPTRLYPAYFDFPFVQSDDVSIALPAGWGVKSVPQPRSDDLGAIGYRIAAEAGGGSVHLSRTMKIDLTLVSTARYGALRQFFDAVRSGDAEQIVLTPNADPAH